jgi:hypothetical protein
MRSLFAILVLLSPSALIAGTPSVVLGKAHEQFAIDAEVPCPQEENDENDLDVICMDAWIGWRINVQKTLAGNPIRGRIRAARLQHTFYIKSYLRRLRLFVLQPIESAEMRAVLGADYLIIDLSTTRDMYCTRESPAKYGLPEEDLDVYVRQAVDDEAFCFELPKEGE